MEPIEATLLRVTADWSDYRIDTFNLVIRLSKVEQSAFPFVCLFVQSCGSRCPLWTFGIFISSRLQPYRTATNFFRCCSSFYRARWHEPWQAIGCDRHVLFQQVRSFWYLVRLNILRPQFNGTWIAVYAHVAGLDHGPFLGTTRDYLGLNWVLLILIVLVVSPWSPTSPPFGP